MEEIRISEVDMPKDPVYAKLKTVYQEVGRKENELIQYRLKYNLESLSEDPKISEITIDRMREVLLQLRTYLTSGISNNLYDYIQSLSIEELFSEVREKGRECFSWERMQEGLRNGNIFGLKADFSDYAQPN